MKIRGLRVGFCRAITGVALGMAISIALPISGLPIHSSAISQGPITPAPVTQLPIAQSQEPPAQVSPTNQNPANRLLPDQLVVAAKEIDSAPIYLDGRTLFEVGALKVENQQPAEVRAQEIQRRLYKIAKLQSTKLRNAQSRSAQSRNAQSQNTLQNFSSPSVTITLDEPSNLPVISVGNQELLTITNADVQLGGQATLNDRAVDLRDILRDAFSRYRQERQRTFWQGQLKIVAGIITGALLLTGLASRWRKRLRHRQTRLANANTQLGSSRGSHPLVELPFSAGFNPVFDLLKARLDNRQKRKITEALLGSLFIFQLGLWLGSALWILALFPQSRWLTTLLLTWVKIPASILLLCGIAYLAVRLSSLVIDRVGLTLQEGAQWAPEQSQRLNLRFVTFSQVAKGIAGSVIFALTVLFSLALSGVKVAPLLAGAGIIGVGISLAAQSLIKDFINGFLILSEDHFGIGDVVTIEGISGTVEYVNLRITQLRDTEGKLITIPNSQISIVQNLSMDWAQVDFSIVVAASTPLDKALTLLQETANTLAEEPRWQQFILEPPDVLGVESLDNKGMTLRLWLKTKPLKQWVVARELRSRIKHAFDQAGIVLGIPHEQIAVHWESSMPQIPSTQPPSPETPSTQTPSPERSENHTTVPESTTNPQD